MTRVRHDLLTAADRRQIPRKRHRLSLDDEVGRGWIIAVSIAWPVLYGVGWALEPPPADPAAVPGVIEGTIALLLLGAILVMARGFSLRQRFGFAGSLAAAGILLGMVIACPATGHHAVGGWWYGQLAAAGTLVGISAAGLRGARSLSR